MSGEKTLEFRYTKKEQFLGIGWLIAFLFFIGLGACIPFIVKRQTPGDIYAMVTWFSICFIGIFYSINLWLRRRSFFIKVDNDGFVISKLGKSQRIHWKDIKSYVYQYGHHFWFISLLLRDRRRITIYGELVHFGDFIKIIKENVSLVVNEFQYTMRKRMVILLFVILLFFNIVLDIPLLKYGFIRRMPWSDVLGIVALFSGSSLLAIFQNFRWGLIRFFISNDGLSVKPWLVGRKVFISWLEIDNDAKIEIKDAQFTLVARVWRLAIKSNNKSILFCEDLDNVDELINIIEDKTGIKLNL